MLALCLHRNIQNGGMGFFFDVLVAMVFVVPAIVGDMLLNAPPRVTSNIARCAAWTTILGTVYCLSRLAWMLIVAPRAGSILPFVT
jgi:hypothetical protein